MKLVKVTPQKLFLNLETPRLLNAGHLTGVVAGMLPKTDHCTAGPCGTSRAICP